RKKAYGSRVSRRVTPASCAGGTGRAPLARATGATRQPTPPQPSTALDGSARSRPARPSSAHAGKVVTAGTPTQASATETSTPDRASSAGAPLVLANGMTR